MKNLETKREPSMIEIEKEVHQIALEEAQNSNTERIPTLDEMGEALKEVKDRELWTEIQPLYDGSRTAEDFIRRDVKMRELGINLDKVYQLERRYRKK